MKERISDILHHLIDSAKLQKDEDLELCLSVVKGALDRDCIDELADTCMDFTEKKITKRMILEN